MGKRGGWCLALSIWNSSDGLPAVRKTADLIKRNTHILEHTHSKSVNILLSYSLYPYPELSKTWVPHLSGSDVMCAEVICTKIIQLLGILPRLAHLYHKWLNMKPAFLVLWSHFILAGHLLCARHHSPSVIHEFMWSSQQACEMSILDPETESQRGNTVWICFTPAFFEYLEYCVPSPRLIILHASEDSQLIKKEPGLDWVCCLCHWSVPELPSVFLGNCCLHGC